MRRLAMIGNGSHAKDILADMEESYRVDHYATHDLYQPENIPVLIAINDPQTRAKIAAELGITDIAWVHTSARLHQDVHYAHGVHINYGVHAIRAGIGAHTTISPGVTICGDVLIGQRCLIGAGAVICDRVMIGDDVTIGAGTTVPPEWKITSGTWVGPAPHQIR